MTSTLNPERQKTISPTLLRLVAVDLPFRNGSGTGSCTTLSFENCTDSLLSSGSDTGPSCEECILPSSFRPCLFVFYAFVLVKELPYYSAISWLEEGLWSFVYVSWRVGGGAGAHEW